MAEIVVTGACIRDDDGAEVARIEAITVGGGVQVVTVDGVPEERHHPTFHRFHIRLISPDRMIPDQLHEADRYDDAVEIGLRYAKLRAEHADRVAALTDDLKITG